MEELKHYRYGGKLEFAGVEMLGQKEKVVVDIDHIAFHDSYKVQGSLKPNVWIAYLKPNPYTTLPILLNSTNRKRLAKLAKTDFLQTVKNFRVGIVKEWTRDPVDGGQIEGLRISKTPEPQPKPEPKKKPVLEIGSENYAKCVAYIKEGKDFAALDKAFEISEEVKAKLMEDAK